MSLKEKLEEELKMALKAGKKEAVAALRLTLSEIKSAEKDKRRDTQKHQAANLHTFAHGFSPFSVSRFSKGRIPCVWSSTMILDCSFGKTSCIVSM